jgi:hypothetical protein
MPVTAYPRLSNTAFSSSGITKTFVDGDLDGNGTLIFQHNLPDRVKFITVVDDGGDFVVPGGWRSDFDQAFVDLTAFVGFAGTWTIFYR